MTESAAAPSAAGAPSPGSPAAAARLAGRLTLGQDGHGSGAAVPKVPTGIRGFDHVAMGGLPERRTTVVAGPAGAAKTLFAAQFLAEGVRRGEAGVFVTLEEPAADLRANLATLGWDVPRWEAEGLWRFVDSSPLSVPGAGSRPELHVETLAAQVGAAVDRTGARRLVLDSLSAVLGLQGDGALARQMLRDLALRLRHLGTTVVMTVETPEDPTGALTRYGVEEFVADSVVLLRNVHEATFRRRTVEVLKMRGAMHHKGDVPFTVVPGEGLRVLPVGTPDARSPRRSGRLPSAVAGWEALTHGGLFRSSTTLVTGPTGSGKTMLVTRFAADGLAAGETVLVVAYEESSEQVLDNVEAIGWDVRAPEQAGRLHVVPLHPDVASLDDHLVELEALVERVRPDRLVLDGLSALQRLGSETSFRGFLVGVVGLARGSGLAAHVTASSSSSAGGAPSTTDHVVGLVDTVVVLRHHEDGAVVRRGVHVQRMRGSSHERTVHELVVDERGVSVGELLPLPPALPAR